MSKPMTEISCEDAFEILESVRVLMGLKPFVNMNKKQIITALEDRWDAATVDPRSKPAKTPTKRDYGAKAGMLQIMGSVVKATTEFNENDPYTRIWLTAYGWRSIEPQINQREFDGKGYLIEPQHLPSESAIKMQDNPATTSIWLGLKFYFEHVDQNALVGVYLYLG